MVVQPELNIYWLIFVAVALVFLALPILLFIRVLDTRIKTTGKEGSTKSLPARSQRVVRIVLSSILLVTIATGLFVIIYLY